MDLEIIFIKLGFTIQIAFILAVIFSVIISYMITNCRRTLNSKYILAKYYEKERIEMNKVV